MNEAAGSQLPEPSAGAVALSVRDLTCSYGGVQAVRNVSFDIPSGTFVGLIGPNGAGKSTLIDCVSGYNRRFSGKVLLNGRGIARKRPEQIARLGLTRGFQAARVFREMTCLENVAVAAQRPRGETVAHSLLGDWRTEDAATLDRAGQILTELDLRQMSRTYAKELSGGQQRLLELSRILMVSPSVLLLDEPFVGVSPANRQRLADQLRGLVLDRGITVLMVEHRLELVERLCERVIVMAEGGVLATGTMSEMRSRAEVLDAYLGRRATGDAR